MLLGSIIAFITITYFESNMSYKSPKQRLIWVTKTVLNYMFLARHFILLVVLGTLYLKWGILSALVGTAAVYVLGQVVGSSEYGRAIRRQTARSYEIDPDMGKKEREAVVERMVKGNTSN